ncbi:ORF080 [Staphylococcus phage 37]|uniref:ORF080 n=1 Tax=Staphylococcus phage 37 TaxID=2936813 RepID=Q4ZCC2_9CAUD|nr:ORF080 [Staphylococcus phage 37]
MKHYFCIITPATRLKVISMWATCERTDSSYHNRLITVRKPRLFFHIVSTITIASPRSCDRFCRVA